jgi:hypothetical protein
MVKEPLKNMNPMLFHDILVEKSIQKITQEQTKLEKNKDE